MAITTPYAFTTGDDATATRLNTRSSAISELQSPPRCHAYEASVTVNTTTATQTSITFDAEEVDTDAIHSTSVNTSRMTIVTAGRYRCIGQIAWTSNATGYRLAALTKNGGTIAQTRTNALSGAATVQQVYDEILCVAGDFIELQGLQTSGGNLATLAGAGNTFLHVAWCSLT